MTKRGNGEGSISKRSDGRWMARVSLPTGKRLAIYGKTRSEVSKKMSDVLSDVNAGKAVTTGRTTVKRYLEDWFRAHKDRVRPSTADAYEVLLRLHAYPTIGRVQLTRLDVHHLERMYAQKLEEGLAPATVRQLHAILRNALDKAARVGTIARNPAALAKPPRVPRKPIHPLTLEQVRSLLKEAQGDRHEGLYVLALSTGMRIGELLALQWRDVDLDADVLQVRKTLRHHRKGGGWTMAEPNSKRSRRRIALSTTAVAALRAHRARQATERLALVPAWEDHDLVFPASTGMPMRANNLRRRSFRPLLAAAKLPPKTRLHDRRHTAATLLLLQNVHVKVVSEMLGHSSVALTLDTYSHVMPTMQQTAAQAMDSLLKGSEEAG